MSSDTPISTQAQVVLIDDDPHLRQALSQTLDLAGLEVASLGDARDLAARLPAEWQGVIVSDIRMPGMDGMAFLKRLMGLDSGLPVILIDRPVLPPRAVAATVAEVMAWLGHAGTPRGV